MLVRATVTLVDGRSAKVIFKDMQNITSGSAKVVDHILNLKVGDSVVVAIFNGSYDGGVIIGRY